MVRNLSRISALVLLLSPAAHGVTRIWTADTTLPKTLGSGYQGDSIVFAADLSSTGNGIDLQTSRVKIDGNGHTLFFGTSGGSNLIGIQLTGAGDSAYIFDLNIIHDPDNDGDAEDTADAAANTFCIHFNGGPYKFNLVNCSLVVYGDNGMNINTAGTGVGTRNITIDSCHFWNYSWAFASRHNYDGASVRITQRGTPFTGPDFAVHIYRSVVHLAPQIGFAIYGDKNSSVNSKGIEIAYCSTYVDAHTAGAQLANQYGMLFRMCEFPFSVHDNYIGAGTKYGGSRGMMLEDVEGHPNDYAKIYNNTIKVWVGPDLENAAGECRGIRIRNIDGQHWDYLHIYDNWAEIVVDNSVGTGHIGANGYVINLTIDGLSPGFAHGIIENNTFVLRSLASSGTNGAAGHYGVSFIEYPGVPPLTIRNNKYISSDHIIWGADYYNTNGCHDLTFEGDTLSFLPAGDSGYNLSDRVTWEMGADNRGTETSNNNVALNCYYMNNAEDTNIYLDNDGASHDLTLTQRITLYAVGNDDSLVPYANFRVVNGKGQTICNDSSSTGDTTVDCRYWKTYGNGWGSDSNFNTPSEFDIIVKKGTDSTIITDTFINWRTTCIIVDLASTSGTLPFDSCQVYTAPSCPIATPISPPYSDTIEQHIDTLYADITLDAADDTVIAKFLGGTTSTPTTVLLTDTIGKDTTNWRYIWTSLVEDSTYYWRVVAADDDCVDTTAVWHFHVDSVKAVIADTGKQGIDGVTLDGVEIGMLSPNMEQTFSDEVQTDGRYEICSATSRRGTACYPDWCIVRSDW